MRITKDTSAIIEVNSEELGTLSDICEIVRRCLDNSYSREYAGNMVSSYEEEKEKIRKFIQTIFDI